MVFFPLSDAGRLVADLFKIWKISTYYDFTGRAMNSLQSSHPMDGKPFGVLERKKQQ